MAVFRVPEAGLDFTQLPPDVPVPKGMSRDIAVPNMDWFRMKLEEPALEAQWAAEEEARQAEDQRLKAEGFNLTPGPLAALGATVTKTDDDAKGEPVSDEQLLRKAALAVLAWAVLS